MRPFFSHHLARTALVAAAVLAVLSCGNTSTIVSLQLTPAKPMVVSGSTVQFTATALFSNGMRVYPWSVVNWSSTDTSVAAIGTNGVVTALSPGVAVISVQDQQHPGIVSSATLTVTNMPLAALTAVVDSPIMIPKTTTQARATGIYPDGSKHDMTSSVFWKTSSVSIATVSNVQGESGLVTAVAAGSVTITATDLLTGISADTVVVVAP